MREEKNHAAEREAARDHPDQAVDELEQRWFPAEEDDGEQADEAAPVIEQDLDAQDLGSADAADEPSG